LTTDASPLDPGWPIERWAAHNAYRLILGIGGPALALNAVALAFGQSQLGLFASVFASLGSIVVTLIAFTAFMHQIRLFDSKDRLCSGCYTGIPDNTDLEVKKYDRTLRMFHLVADHEWLRIAAIVVFGFSQIVLPFIGWSTGYSLGGVSSTVFLVAVMAMAWTLRHHGRLMPWCPYCDDWEDGPGPREPSPDPQNQNQPTS
jgi:hypothetical protein